MANIKYSCRKSSQPLNFFNFYVYLLIIKNIILISEFIPYKIIYSKYFYFVNKVFIQDYKILIQQRFFNKFNFYLKIKYNNNGGKLCYLKN